MGPPFGADHGVNLIQDDRSDPRQHFLTATGAQEEIQAFRRGDEDFRGPAPHPPAFFRRGIAAARQEADGGERLAGLPEIGLQPFQRQGQVAPDIIFNAFKGET